MTTHPPRGPLAVASLLAWACMAAAPTPPLPPHTPLIAEDAIKDFRVTGSASATAKSKLVPFADAVAADAAAGNAAAGNAAGFGQALQVTTARRAATEYAVQYELKLPDVALKKGDVIWAAVSARMIATQDESGQGVLGLVL
jgi:hypothetical protein